MKTNEKTEAMVKDIERQATGAFGTYNPVAAVKCPHCGGTMQAIDAKKHVRQPVPSWGERGPQTEAEYNA